MGEGLLASYNLISMFYFRQLLMCVREVKVCINRIWKTGASHSQHVFIQPVHYENTGVQNEAPATLVMPFKAENEITEKESHNPQWTKTGFQPNSSSIPPSNNTQSHQPLTLKRHKEWKKNNHHSWGGGRAKRPKRKLDQWRSGGRIKYLCSFSDWWQNC